VAVAVNLFGPVAMAVAVLVGPVFIPFFIVPKLEWLFWGWLKFFIAYAFNGVIAAAVTFVLCNIVVDLLTVPPFYPYPAGCLLECGSEICGVAAF
jgi:type IV secretory pathway VirB6-like protein